MCGRVFFRIWHTTRVGPIPAHTRLPYRDPSPNTERLDHFSPSHMLFRRLFSDPSFPLGRININMWTVPEAKRCVCFLRTVCSEGCLKFSATPANSSINWNSVNESRATLGKICREMWNVRSVTGDFFCLPCDLRFGVWVWRHELPCFLI